MAMSTSSKMPIEQTILEVLSLDPSKSWYLGELFEFIDVSSNGDLINARSIISALSRTGKIIYPTPNKICLAPHKNPSDKGSNTMRQTYEIRSDWGKAIYETLVKYPDMEWDMYKVMSLLMWDKNNATLRCIVSSTVRNLANHGVLTPIKVGSKLKANTYKFNPNHPKLTFAASRTGNSPFPNKVMPTQSVIEMVIPPNQPAVYLWMKENGTYATGTKETLLSQITASGGGKLYKEVKLKVKVEIDE